MKNLLNRVDSNKKVRRKVVITLTDTRIKRAVIVKLLIRSSVVIKTIRALKTNEHAR